MKRHAPLNYLCLEPGLNIKIKSKRRTPWLKTIRNLINCIFHF